MSDEEEKPLSPRHTSTTWKPGQSGNPKGRPSKEVEREYLDIMITACTPERWANIVERAIHDAEKGDKFARDWVSAHLIGEPKRVHEYMINENRSVLIEVRFVQPGDTVEGMSPIMLQEGELIETDNDEWQNQDSE